MVYMHRIYTKSGDHGKTMLGDSSTVDKTNLRIQAMAEVDLVNSQLGMALLHTENSDWVDKLHLIQNQLFDLGADLCVPEQESYEYPPLRVKLESIQQLEHWMDELTPAQKPLDSFILPGGTTLAAYLHVARSTCRIAEISTWKLHHESSINLHIPQYLNRLADFLFVLAREANGRGNDDLKWVPGK